MAWYRAARGRRWWSASRNFCGLKRRCEDEEERSAARGHYIGNISAVIPVSVSSPILFLPYCYTLASLPILGVILNYYTSYGPLPPAAR